MINTSVSILFYFRRDSLAPGMPIFSQYGEVTLAQRILKNREKQTSAICASLTKRRCDSERFVRQPDPRPQPRFGATPKL
jgi:hypothetical protein